MVDFTFNTTSWRKRNMKTKRTFQLSILSIVSFTLILFSLGMVNPAFAADKPDKIKIGTFGDASTLKIGWAKGWFAEATGCETSFKTFDSGADVIMSLASGDLDISSLGSSPTTIAVARNVPIKVIAIEMDLASNEAMIVRDGINLLSDLKGKKIAVPFSSTCHYALMRTLSLYNMDPKSIDILDMGSMEAAGAFKGGMIDGAWVWDPAYTEMVNSGGHILITSGMVGKMGYPTWNNIVVRKKFAEQYPEVVANWLGAFMRTVDFYHENPDEAATVVANQLSMDPNTAKKVMSRYGFLNTEQQVSPKWLGTEENPGQVVKGMQDTSEFLVNQGSIKKVISLDKCRNAIERKFFK